MPPMLKEDVMSRQKTLPDDVKQMCLSLVRGYERRKKEYKLRREELIHNTPSNLYTIKDKNDPYNERKHIGVMLPGSHLASRTTENLAQRLEDLENLPDTRRMRAVEHALDRVGMDLPEYQQKLLRKAIYTSCIQGRKYPFERLQVEGMERTCFYDRRLKFLVEIAHYMDM